MEIKELPTRKLAMTKIQEGMRRKRDEYLAQKAAEMK
jgi:hypothetical protein